MSRPAGPACPSAHGPSQTAMREPTSTSPTYKPRSCRVVAGASAESVLRLEHVAGDHREAEGDRSDGRGDERMKHVDPMRRVVGDGAHGMPLPCGDEASSAPRRRPGTDLSRRRDRPGDLPVGRQDSCPGTIRHDRAHTLGMGALHGDRGAPNRWLVPGSRSLCCCSGACRSRCRAESCPAPRWSPPVPSCLDRGLIVAGFALSGAALIHLRPRNSIGWILLVSGLLQVTNVAADAYATRALTDPDHSLPLGLRPGVARIVDLAPVAAAAGDRAPAAVPDRPTIVAPSGGGTCGPRCSVSGWSCWRWRPAPAASTTPCAGPGCRGRRLVDLVRVGLSAAALLIATAAVHRRRAPSSGRWRAKRPGAAAVAVAAQRGRGDGRHDVHRLRSPVRARLRAGPGRRGDRRTALRPARDRGRPASHPAVRPADRAGRPGRRRAHHRTRPAGTRGTIAAARRLGRGGSGPGVRSPAGCGRAVDRLVLGERADPLTLVDRVGAGLEVEHDDPVASMLEAVASAAGASYAVVRDERRAAACPGRWDRRPVLELPAAPRRRGTWGCSTVGAAPRSAVADGPGPAAGDRSRAAPGVVVRSPPARRGPRPRTHPGHHGHPRGAGPTPPGPARRARPLAVRHRARARGGLDGATTPTPTPSPTLLDERAPRPRWRSARFAGCSTGYARLRSTCTGSTARSATPRRRSEWAVLVARTSISLRPAAVAATGIEEAAFRIVAESLTNVVRHSDADHCAVRLQQANGDLRVRVFDDGSGLGVDQSQGHGLDSMRRRAADVGGSLIVDPADPHGHCRHRRTPAGGPA